MRLIDVDNVIHDCKALANDKWNKKVSPVSWADAYQAFVDYLEETPTVDVRPVVHGRWVLLGVGGYAGPLCSVCQDKMSWFLQRTTRYCPNCGAKMDGGDEDGR